MIPKTFNCMAFRWERYVAHKEIVATSQEQAMDILKELDADDALDFDTYTEDAMDADSFAVMHDDLDDLWTEDQPTRAELIDALRLAHSNTDWMMAQLIAHTYKTSPMRTFMPTTCPIWQDIVHVADTIIKCDKSALDAALDAVADHEPTDPIPAAFTEIK